MKRRIIRIDEEKCTGCGLCANACHEGAIAMIGGRAKLIREDFCDGLGDCLPACPAGAISFEEREAAAYDENAVNEAKKLKQRTEKHHLKHHSGHNDKLPCGCPGTQAKAAARSEERDMSRTVRSRLMQWPCQIKLVPVNAPYFDNAQLLIAADCTAYAYGDFHSDFMKNHITLIGCPKLDEGDYAQKLSAIIKNNNIKSVTVVRMEVPCCGGLENAVKRALTESGSITEYRVVTIGTDGRILS